MSVVRLNTAAEAADVADRVARTRTLAPFGPAALAFTKDLSATVLGDAHVRGVPEAVALGYWLRPTSARALAERFATLDASNALRVPVGTALHIPPSNVDVMFVYSWVLSLLCGNRNIVRLSSSRGPVADRLLDVVERVLAGHPAVAETTALVEYGHQEEITRALSARTDLRVIWGGDETVSRIRAIPLPPRAKEVVFADRRSFAAVAARPFLDLGEAEAQEIARRLFLDVFLFNQRACSSVRLLAWCGTVQDTDAASHRMETLLRAEVERRSVSVDASVALAKYAFACRTAVDLPVRSASWRDARFVLIDLGREVPESLGADHVGGGTLFQLHVDDLSALEPLVDARVQTMSQYGFAHDDLAGFVRLLNGKGIDRMVPLGGAMAFSPLWDGYDLLAEFTRVVMIDAGGLV